MKLFSALRRKKTLDADVIAMLAQAHEIHQAELEESQLPIAEKMLSGELPMTGALGLRMDLVPAVFQEELAREGYRPVGGGGGGGGSNEPLKVTPKPLFPKFGTPEFDAKAEKVAKAQEADRARAALTAGQLAQRFAEEHYGATPQVPAVPND